jgi:hypothetical protein
VRKIERLGGLVADAAAAAAALLPSPARTLQPCAQLGRDPTKWHGERWHEVRTEVGPEAGELEHVVPDAKGAKAFDLGASIYGPRCKHADTKDFYNCPPFFDPAKARDISRLLFQLDWRRMVSKRTFSKFLHRELRHIRSLAVRRRLDSIGTGAPLGDTQAEAGTRDNDTDDDDDQDDDEDSSGEDDGGDDGGGGGGVLPEEKELRKALKQAHTSILDAFSYNSSLSGSGCYSMQLNAYTDFCQVSQVLDGNGNGNGNGGGVGNGNGSARPSSPAPPAGSGDGDGMSGGGDGDGDGGGGGGEEARAGTASGSRPLFTAGDLGTIFVVVNHGGPEEERRAGGARGGHGNDIRSVVRHEFLECIVRVAMLKYCTAAAHQAALEAALLASADQGPGVKEPFVPPEVVTPGAAVRRLLQEHVVRFLDPTAAEDTDVFRRNFLYTQEVEQQFASRRQVLNMLFVQLCKAERQQLVMTMGEWTGFLGNMELFDATFTNREGRLCFARSKLRAVDELKNARTTHNLGFVDFLEVTTQAIISESESE